MYRLRSVRMCYGSKVALEIDDLSIARGRLHMLCGANGAGKSTLLHLLAFLRAPAAGEVEYAGLPVAWDRASMGRHRRRVTLVHQSPYLFGGTVRTNVAFGLEARGVRGEEQARRVRDALDAVCLGDFAGRDARKLSGGEAQRVAVARALALEPEVLLLDEPLANIDREATALLETVIASLPGRGATVVMTTHDHDRAGRLGGDPIELDGGRLAERPARETGV